MKTVKTYRRMYWYGVAGFVGPEVSLSKHWRVVKENDECWLEFKTTQQEWLTEDDIIIVEREMFSNECS